MTIKQTVSHIIKEMSRKIEDSGFWIDSFSELLDLNNILNDNLFREELLNHLFYLMNNQKEAFMVCT